ncbi:MAG: hypothetical protein JSS81_13715 [Acidobacteria bacterium]|nr:hypothetical protein [Acidobacteriota bacterium]
MSIRWIEINPAAPSGATMAGRRDTPAGDPTEANVATVQFFLNTANLWSLNYRIGRELTLLEPRAESIIPADSTDGVMANVLVTTISEPWSGVSSTGFGAIDLAGPPQHFSAIDRALRAAQRVRFMWSSPGAVSHRYFWGIRG